MIFTSVYFEKNRKDAIKRLEELRKVDKFPELKAYIKKMPSEEYRVLRKIEYQKKAN